MSKEIVKQEENKVTVKKQMTSKEFFNQPFIAEKFAELLGAKAVGFVTSILQTMQANTKFANVDPMSIYNAASTAAILDLPINSNLGFAYIIPYGQAAQFQLGYKGYIQLAQRSGQFKTISVSEVYEGQLIANNPLEGCEFDWENNESEKVIGYVAYFKLLNGFEKTLYMTEAQMKKHGAEFSKNFNSNSSLWKKKPIAMGNKTALKLLLSKFAPLSIEMQKAILVDQGVIGDADGNKISYPDNATAAVIIDKEKERFELMLGDCTTIEEVESVETFFPDENVDAFNAKKAEIKKKSEK